MLSGISNPFGTEKQVASLVFYTAAGLLAGRKVFQSVGCALMAKLMKKNADEWNQASAQYLDQAKKDAVRDVAAVAGFVGALALVSYANEILVEREKESQPLSNETIEKLKGAGIAYGVLYAPSFLRRLGFTILNRCSAVNYTISESVLCMPVNQIVVRPSMYLLSKCLCIGNEYRFKGIGLSSLCRRNNQDYREW